MRKSISGSKPKKKTESASADKPSLKDPIEINKDDKQPFDFGGLPVRDLKKNLGCG